MVADPISKCMAYLSGGTLNLGYKRQALQDTGDCPEVEQTCWRRKQQPPQNAPEELPWTDLAAGDPGSEKVGVDFLATTLAPSCSARLWMAFVLSVLLSHSVVADKLTRYVKVSGTLEILFRVDCRQ